jgi:hypothetical protein
MSSDLRKEYEKKGKMRNKLKLYFFLLFHVGRKGGRGNRLNFLVAILLFFISEFRLDFRGKKGI